MHKLQQCLVTNMQLTHCQPLGRLARVSDNAGAMNDWLMHTGVTTNIPRFSPSAMQPVNRHSIGIENELLKYRLSEVWLLPNVTPESWWERKRTPEISFIGILVVSECDSGISPSSMVPRRVRSIWAHFRFSHFIPMDLEIMPTILDLS